MSDHSNKRKAEALEGKDEGIDNFFFCFVFLDDF